jgi:NADH-quinone oxidoreductase subunit B
MGLEAALPPDTFVTTQLRRVINWARRSSLWPMPFATACCGIELMATACSRYDMARFGCEAVRFSPRQSDLMIVAGRVSTKMMPVLQRIYLQMSEPKWVISMGACASTGGVFDTYAVVQGVDQFIPVDVYVPGCPPRPEQLLEGIMAIQKACPPPAASACRWVSPSPPRIRSARSPWACLWGSEIVVRHPHGPLAEASPGRCGFACARSRRVFPDPPRAPSVRLTLA